MGGWVGRCIRERVSQRERETGRGGDCMYGWVGGWLGVWVYKRESE